MESPTTADYGFAWEITKQNGHRLIEHGGAWQGFTSQISRYSDDSLTVVVLANSDRLRPDYMAHVIAGARRRTAPTAKADRDRLTLNPACCGHR